MASTEGKLQQQTKEKRSSKTELKNKPARTSRKKAPGTRPQKTLDTRAERMRKRSEKGSTSENKKTEQKQIPNQRKQTKRQPMDRSDFVETDRIKELVSRTTPYLQAGYPLHLTGPTGVGKTALALHLASKFDRPVMLLHGNHEMNNEDLIGSIAGFTSEKVIDNFVRQVYKKQEEVKEKWHPGRLVEAIQKGYTLIYDEFSRSSPETNNLFLSVLEEGVLPLYGTKQKQSFLKVHKDFRVIFTSNPEEYAGVFDTQDALIDRMITIEMNNETQTEREILRNRCNILAKEADIILKITGKVRKACEKENKNGPSLRASLMIATICKKSEIPISTDNQQFTTVCKDILASHVVKCLDGKTIKDAEEWVEEIS